MSSVAVLLDRRGGPDVTNLERALAAAPHRGAVTEMILLGSTALGISRHDSEQRGGVALDGQLAAAVAGTISNCEELLAELRIAGAAPDSSNPAAIVLAAYRALGDMAAHRLRGEYAVVISDGSHLRCFRDHLGFGTLFMRDEPGAFFAASEAKQVAAAANRPPTPALDVLEAVFYAEETDATPSFLRGIDRLPKATILVANSDGTSQRRYWHPERMLETARYDYDEIAERFQSLMSRAVARTLVGQDAIALSGGVDSPTVASFAAPIHRERFGGPLLALSMVFPDYPTCDESRYIDSVALHLDMPVHRYQPSKGGQSLAQLGEWARMFDGPWSGAWAPGMDAERYPRLHAAGTPNLLTGDLAEYEMDFRQHLIPHLLMRGRAGAVLRTLKQQHRRGTPFSGIVKQLAAGLLPGGILRRYRRWRPRFPTAPWVDRSRVLQGISSDLISPRDRWRRHQLAAFVGPGISMEAHQIFDEAWRVQQRRPWGDVDLWEFFLSLRAEDKFPTAESKGLVRAIMRGRLPDEILDRHDKTLLNEFVLASFDYPSLRRWLSVGDYRMPGVDYQRLHEALDRQDLGIFDYLWAKDLAAVHAFLADSLPTESGVG